MQIETSRLILRLLIQSGAHFLYPMTSKERVAQFIQFDTHTSFQQAKDRVTEYLSLFQKCNSVSKINVQNLELEKDRSY